MWPEIDYLGPGDPPATAGKQLICGRDSPTQGTSTIPPPYFGARANFAHISTENTTLAIQQIRFHRREYFDSEKSGSKVKILDCQGF